MGEDHRIAALEASHRLSLAGKAEKESVDLSLIRGVRAAELPDIELLLREGFDKVRVGKRVVDDGIALPEEALPPYGHEIRISRAEPDKVDASEALPGVNPLKKRRELLSPACGRRYGEASLERMCREGEALGDPVPEPQPYEGAGGDDKRVKVAAVKLREAGDDVAPHVYRNDARVRGEDILPPEGRA